jgi:PAS domain S-box-containing protein
MVEGTGTSEGTFVDDTGREEADRRFRTLADAVEEGVYRLDSRGRFVAVNDAFVATTGYERAKLLESDASLVFDDDAVDRLARVADGAPGSEGEADGGFEAVLETAGGESIPCELEVLELVDEPDEQEGRGAGILGLLRETPGRGAVAGVDVREHERKFERTERRFEAVFEDPNILVGLLEPDGTVLDINETAMEYVDADLDAVRGGPFWESPWWGEDESVRSDVRAWTERAAAGEYVDFEADLVRHDGEQYTINGYFRPVTDDDGEVVSIIVSDRDVTERKRHERELELFRTLLDHSNDSVLVIDPETGRFLDANDTACQRRGYAREELLDMTVPDLEEEFSNIDQWRSHVEDIRARGSMTFDGTHRRKDGTTYPVEVNVTFVELDEKYVVAIVRDVTERRKRKQELERYETIVETIPDGTYVLDEDHRFREVNDALVEMTGYGREELLGVDAEIISTEGGHERGMELRRQLKAGEIDVAVLEEEIQTADGDTFDAEIRFDALFDDDGTFRGTAGVIRDITDRKRRERTLREERNLIEQIVEISPIGIATVESDGTFDILNDRTTEILGLEREAISDPEERVGRLDPVRPDGEPFAVDEIPDNRVLEGERFYDVEVGVRRPDGERVWTSISGTPLRDEQGRVTGGVLTFADITDRQEYERKLEASNERLEQFAYAASHDLQEPLRMVSSYLQLLERRYGDELGEDGEEFLAFAVDGAERMKAMIEALLAYSRVETRGDPFEPVDLEPLLEDVLADLQLHIDESDAAVTAGSLPTVEGDASQLRQVFQNLLDNAVEYSGDDPPRIRLEAERSGTQWVVSVEDEGIGIDPDDQNRVFEVFQRLHSHEEHEGTGIGLALCRRIIERHGGDIWVESESGEGSTFYFTLPAADDAEP